MHERSQIQRAISVSLSQTRLNICEHIVGSRMIFINFVLDGETRAQPKIWSNVINITVKLWAESLDTRRDLNHGSLALQRFHQSLFDMEYVGTRENYVISWLYFSWQLRQCIIGSKLGHRRRRWPSFDPILAVLLSSWRFFWAVFTRA